jgi:hypothetical protein
MVVVLVVAVVSMGEDLVVVSTAAVLGAQSAAAVVELALGERTSQVALRTLLAPGRGSLQWVIHHPDSLSMMDGLIDP